MIMRVVGGMQHSREDRRWCARIYVWLLSLACATGLGCGSSSAPGSSQTAPPPPVFQQNLPVTQLSADTFTNTGSQHATEVEAGIFAFGTTVVSAFQVGRIFGGGAADIGFATSSDGGATWVSGLLPGTTLVAGGSFNAISDPVPVFDAAHAVWMISTLPITAKDQVAVSRSTDALNWQNPTIVSSTPDADKNWIACDNTSTSAFFGHCYVQWDDPSTNGLIWMSTSSDGGQTWGTAKNTANLAAGIAGEPLVQPNGTVVVPILNFSGTQMLAFSSNDGGATWGPTVVISTVSDHQVAGNLRAAPLPSAAIDAAGTLYVSWQDCRFRTGCSANDLVLSTSTDGSTWSTPARIPIDSITSSVDHFIPGLGVDGTTSGSLSRLALTYYFYPAAQCAASTCALNLGFISSADGGSTWTTPVTIASGMSVSSLPNTFSGPMVGDYLSTVFSGGHAFSVFAVAQAKSGTLFDEPMYTTTAPFNVAESFGALSSAGELPVPGATSDHPPRRFFDQEHRYPVTPP